MSRILVFPGQGSQAIGMGKDFYDAFPTAKAVFDEVDDTLNYKLSDTIFNGPIETLSQTEYTQPALMAVSIAVWRVMEQEMRIPWDMFAMTAGHSLGEYTALCAARVLTLADTTRLLKKRGEAFAKAAKEKPGKMLVSLGLPFEKVLDVAIQTQCFIANDNSPEQVVLSGSEENIARATSLLQEAGAKRCLPLPVSGAFHSPFLRGAASEVKEALAEIPMKLPILPVISNVSAMPMKIEKDIKRLLFEQVTSTVRWREIIEKAYQKGITDVVEVGAGKVLGNMAKRIVPEMNGFSICSVSALEEWVSNNR